jgi:glyoxylase I family protein
MAVPPITPFGVHHIAIQCQDLTTMVRFYERVLRLRIERRWQSERAEDGGGDRSVWLRLGTGVLALERCDGEPEAPPWQSEKPGLHLLAVEIAWQNRAVWLAHLEHCGVEVVYESAWTIYVRDPEGNRVGLSHFPFTAEGERTA